MAAPGGPEPPSIEINNVEMILIKTSSIFCYVKGKEKKSCEKGQDFSLVFAWVKINHLGFGGGWGGNARKMLSRGKIFSPLWLNEEREQAGWGIEKKEKKKKKRT